MLKDKLYSDKFFITSLIKFLLAHGIFLGLAVIIAGGGHGTYTQFPIFYGIFFLPTILFKNLIFFTDLNYVFIIAPTMFLIVSLFLFFAIWFKIFKKKSLFFIVLIHFSIALICIVFIEYELKDLYKLSSGANIIGTFVAIIVSCLYWNIFFKVLNYIKMGRVHSIK